MLVLASEVGVLNLPEADVLVKERLHPGKMLLIDTVKKEITSDADIKDKYANAYPYEAWLKKCIARMWILSIM